MLNILGRGTTTCDGITRRELMRVGALSLLGGMTMPRFLQAARNPTGRKAPAKSVILINLFGGPSHLDMFDLKPGAPTEVRGEFSPIATSVAGLRICEHLPRSARLMHRACLIRTLSHGYNSHNPYAVLTGFTGGDDRENYYSKPTDHPGMGAVCRYLGRCGPDPAGYVVMPAIPGYSQGLRRAGPYGGYLGNQHNPLFTTCDPKFDREADPDKNSYDPIAPWGEPLFPSLEPLSSLTADRLDRRRSLLQQIDIQVAKLESRQAINHMSQQQRQALALLTSSKTRQAFDLSKESPVLRDRYGRDLYGSSLLMARRLVEAGTTFVAVNTESRGGGHWDTHEKNFFMLKGYLLPLLDRVFSALLEDLEDRGLLDSTLVVVMGDMGRTPRVNARAGRDHWPQCGFALLAGGGIKAGAVFGETDRQAAYPINNPVSPGDICATIYELLGVDSSITIPDHLARPVHIAHGGAPVRAIMA